MTPTEMNTAYVRKQKNLVSHPVDPSIRICARKLEIAHLGEKYIRTTKNSYGELLPWLKHVQQETLAIQYQSKKEDFHCES